MASKGTNFHVVQRPGGWGVRQEKTQFDSGSYRYQSDAAKIAKTLVQLNGGGEVVIHRLNGEIRDKNTIGRNDPFPPRG